MSVVRDYNLHKKFNVVEIANTHASENAGNSINRIESEKVFVLSIYVQRSCLIIVNRIIAHELAVDGIRSGRKGDVFAVVNLE